MMFNEEHNIKFPACELIVFYRIDSHLILTIMDLLKVKTCVNGSQIVIAGPLVVVWTVGCFIVGWIK